MKRIIAYAMTATMIMGAFPMVASAGTGDITATAKIVGDLKVTSGSSTALENKSTAPELQLKITDAYYATSDTDPEVDVTLTLNNGEFIATTPADWITGGYAVVVEEGDDDSIEIIDAVIHDDDEVTVTFKGRFREGDIICFSLASKMTSTSSGKTASVEVTSDIIDIDLDYAGIYKKGIEVSIDKTVDVAEGEIITLSGKGLRITSTAKNSFGPDTKFTLTLNKGFEFVDEKPTSDTDTWKDWKVDGNKATFYARGTDLDIKIVGIQIEATTAKVGDVATITVKANGVTSVVVKAADIDDEKTVVEEEKKDIKISVEIPVGESYIKVDDERVSIDAPAYISNGYTMLPVRAVAAALGIDENSVKWDATTKTVTIMNGDTAIYMSVGDKLVIVGKDKIVAAAAPEISEGRAFLPMRDLANALGIKDISWDSKTKTASFSGTI